MRPAEARLARLGAVMKRGFADNALTIEAERQGVRLTGHAGLPTLITTHDFIDKTGQRMGHMSMSGPDGAIAAFEPLNVQRKMFIHINNTNPVLISDCEENRILRQCDWELARDGMEVVL